MGGAPPHPAPRAILVEPPSARAEAWAVARAVFLVVLWAALAVSAETYRATGAGAAPAVSPFERRFQDLPSADQRLYRSMQEGVLEAERVRSTTGTWPDVGALAAAGVPPFAPDPLDRAGYTWRRIAGAGKVDYVGTPAGDASRDSFFLIVTEPDPGTPNDPLAATDEIHHRLRDGTMIHVTIWTGPPLAERATEAFALLPQEKGYRQVVSMAAAPPRP